MADLRGKMFERRDNYLVPSDLHAEEWLRELPEGKRILIDHRTPRSSENHAHMFAILRVVCENVDGYPDEESLLSALKIATGHTKPVQLATGEIVQIPESISFAAMSESDFQRWKKRALYVIENHIGMDPQLLLEEAGRRSKRHRR